MSPRLLYLPAALFRAKGSRVEPFPNVSSMSDGDLKEQIDKLTKEEQRAGDADALTLPA